MKMKKLGRTDVMVSDICLGTMTWGLQNTEAEGHAQIDMALDHGINFIDTAEMYPTNPLSKDHYGTTERIIGNWFARTGRRDGEITPGPPEAADHGAMDHLTAELKKGGPQGPKSEE